MAIRTGLRPGFAGGRPASLAGRQGKLFDMLRGSRQGRRVRQGGRAWRDDDARGRLRPFAPVADAGVGADGAHDGVGGKLDPVDALKKIFEDEAEIPGAEGEEPGGVGMTVHGRAAGEVVVAGDIERVVPMDEGFLDGVAVGMVADAAQARVTGGVRPPRPFGRVPSAQGTFAALSASRQGKVVGARRWAFGWASLGYGPLGRAWLGCTRFDCAPFGGVCPERGRRTQGRQGRWFGRRVDGGAGDANGSGLNDPVHITS